jgi:hypothetical protein
MVLFFWGRPRKSRLWILPKAYIAGAILLGVGHCLPSGPLCLLNHCYQSP